ncbi:MAG: nicotinamide riboside transporter PnuC [Saprospiraceae bacterium]|nr:nicotinamide riboside transporter PnuC [Saprospiraceae bacterium]
MEQLMVQIGELSMTQLGALVTGVVYVVLAARERPVCWVFGIVSCALIAWDDFTVFRLYADGVLQLVYVGLGGVGLYTWLSGGREDRPGTGIHVRPAGQHLVAVAIGLLLAVPVAWLLRTYTDAAFGFLDTWTTIMSLYATWLLIRKALGNWIFWIVIDAIYIYLFLARGGLLISLLYFVYLLVAIYGFWHWRRRLSGREIIENISK